MSFGGLWETPLKAVYLDLSPLMVITHKCIQGHTLQKQNLANFWVTTVA